MPKFDRLTAFLAALICAPVAASAAGRSIGSIDEATVVTEHTDFLRIEAESLRDSASGVSDDRSANDSDEEIFGRASALFGAAQGDGGSIGSVDLRGWQKPEIHTENFKKNDELESIDIAGIQDRVRNTLQETEESVPEEVIEAYLYGQEMINNGLKNYDPQNELPDGVLGVYKYTKDEAIGIFLNRMMREVQRWAGNEFAAATDLHESAHARDHQKGDLNPIEVRKGETLAYKTEFLWLNLMDPAGEKLSWARASIGKFATGSTKAPQFVQDYLEHLAMIRDYGNRGNFDGLVAALGYQDRPTNPFRHTEHGHAERGLPDEHGSAEHGQRLLTTPGAVPSRTHAEAVTVRYVEFPG